MFSRLLLWNGALIRLFRSRVNLVLENLVLRQQLAVLKRRHPRPRNSAIVPRQDAIRRESRVGARIIQHRQENKIF